MARGTFPVPSARYILVFLLFIGFHINYTIRVNINLALVAMVNHTAIPRSNVSRSQECDKPAAAGAVPQQPLPDGPFVWGEMITGEILGAFFCGYVLTQLVGGRLAELWNAHRLYACSLVTAGVLSTLSPLAAESDWRVLVAVRLLMGLVLGVGYPTAFVMLRAWVPPRERANMTMLAITGGEFGAVVGLPTAAAIISYLGWEAVFYIQGSYVLVWLIFWQLLADVDPRKHWFITDEELEYLTTTTAPLLARGGQPPLPWRRIITSRPVWAFAVKEFCFCWVFFIMLNSMPQYFSMVLGENISTNALFNSLPYLSMWILGVTSSKLADLAVTYGVMSVWSTRRLFTSLAHMSSVILLTCMAFMGCDPQFMKALVVVAITLQGFNAVVLCQPLDLAPNFAGTVYGLVNTFNALAGFLTPLMVGALTDGRETLAQWRYCFLVSAGVSLVGWAVFLAAGSADEQPWNRADGKLDQKPDSAKQPLQPSRYSSDGKLRQQPDVAKKQPSLNLGDGKLNQQPDVAKRQLSLNLGDGKHGQQPIVAKRQPSLNLGDGKPNQQPDLT